MIFSRPGRSPRGASSGADGAAGHVAQPRGLGLDDAEAGALQAGVDAEDRGRFMAPGWKYQRTEWKNTGAAKHSGATRSSRPTAPVTDARLPQKRTPASFFSAFITNSPSVPQRRRR